MMITILNLIIYKICSPVNLKFRSFVMSQLYAAITGAINRLPIKCLLSGTENQYDKIRMNFTCFSLWLTQSKLLNCLIRNFNFNVFLKSIYINELNKIKTIWGGSKIINWIFKLKQNLFSNLIIYYMCIPSVYKTMKTMR